jgi:hypothetical protein
MMDNKDFVQQWIERNPDIPLHLVVNGPCRRCGKQGWTPNGMLHGCFVPLDTIK